MPLYTPFQPKDAQSLGFFSVGRWKLSLPLIGEIADCSPWGFKGYFVQEETPGDMQSPINVPCKGARRLTSSPKLRWMVQGRRPRARGPPAPLSPSCWRPPHPWQTVEAEALAGSKGSTGVRREALKAVLRSFSFLGGRESHLASSCARGVQPYVWKTHLIFTSVPWRRYQNPSLTAGKKSHSKCRSGTRSP